MFQKYIYTVENFFFCSFCNSNYAFYTIFHKRIIVYCEKLYSIHGSAAIKYLNRELTNIYIYTSIYTMYLYGSVGFAHFPKNKVSSKWVKNIFSIFLKRLNWFTIFT